MILNLTYNGISTNYELQGLMGLTDDDIRRVAEEISGLGEGGLASFVVDRTQDTFYVRPKVPFGSRGFDFGGMLW